MTVSTKFQAMTWICEIINVLVNTIVIVCNEVSHNFTLIVISGNGDFLAVGVHPVLVANKAVFVGLVNVFLLNAL